MQRQFPKLINTDPLLPALVEGLGLVHAISVAKVSTVPAVTKVAILVAKVATVTTSLLKLQEENYNIERGLTDYNVNVNVTVPGV